MQQEQLPGSTQGVEAQLWQVWDLLMKVLETNRGYYLEVKAWLLASLSRLDAPRHERMDALGRYLRPGDGSLAVAAAQQVRQQLLLLWMEQQPQTAAKVVMDQPNIVKRFFEGSNQHIAMWFAHFSMEGMTSFKYGARALAHYALAHRDEVWQYLVWTGKHPQAPVTVATKTHYFCELDVVRTVRAFLDHCPEFWTSTAFTDSVVKAGELLQLSPTFFCKALLDMLDDGGRTAQQLHQELQAWLEQPRTWAPACQRVLHLLTDEQLLQVVQDVGSSPGLQLTPPALHAAARAPPRQVADSTADVAAGGSWLEAGKDMRGMVLRAGARWRSLPHLVLAHALAVNRRQLLQLLMEDEDGKSMLQQLTHTAVQLHPPGTLAATLSKGDAVSEFVATLRDPASSASSRQLLALFTWCLYVALCTHGLARSASDGNTPWLATVLQSLGGAVQQSHDSGAGPDGDAAGSRHAGTHDTQQYTMLSSSSSSSSDTSSVSTSGADSDDTRHTQRKKRHKKRKKRKQSSKHKRRKERKRHRHQHDVVERNSDSDGGDLRASQDTLDMQEAVPTEALMQQLASITWQVTLPESLWIGGAAGTESDGANIGYAGVVTVVDLIDIVCRASARSLLTHWSRH